MFIWKKWGFKCNLENYPHFFEEFRPSKCTPGQNVDVEKLQLSMFQMRSWPWWIERGAGCEKWELNISSCMWSCKSIPVVLQLRPPKKISASQEVFLWMFTAQNYSPKQKPSIEPCNRSRYRHVDVNGRHKVTHVILCINETLPQTVYRMQNIDIIYDIDIDLDVLPTYILSFMHIRIGPCLSTGNRCIVKGDFLLHFIEIYKYVYIDHFPHLQGLGRHFGHQQKTSSCLW